MRTVHSLLALGALAACVADAPQPSERMTRLAAYYAPGVRLGERVDTAAGGYHWAVAPYAGYSDSLYRAPDGLTELTLHLDESLSSEEQRPSPAARVDHLTLYVPTADAAAASERRVRAAFGAPREWCFDAGGRAVRRLLYWPDERGRGILMSVPAGVWPDTAAGGDAWAASHGGLLVLQAEPMDTGRAWRGCDQQPARP